MLCTLQCLFMFVLPLILSIIRTVHSYIQLKINCVSVCKPHSITKFLALSKWIQGLKYPQHETSIIPWPFHIMKLAFPGPQMLPFCITSALSTCTPFISRNFHHSQGCPKNHLHFVPDFSHENKLVIQRCFLYKFFKWWGIICRRLLFGFQKIYSLLDFIIIIFF